MHSQKLYISIFFLSFSFLCVGQQVSFRYFPIEIGGEISKQMSLTDKITFLQKLACLNNRYKKFAQEKLKSIRKQILKTAKEKGVVPEKWAVSKHGGCGIALFYLHHPSITGEQKLGTVKRVINRANLDCLRYFIKRNILAEAREYYRAKEKEEYLSRREMYCKSKQWGKVRKCDAEIQNISLEADLLSRFYIRFLNKQNTFKEVEGVFTLLSDFINPFNAVKVLLFLLCHFDSKEHNILPWFDMVVKTLKVDLKIPTPCGLSPYYKDMFSKACSVRFGRKRGILQKLTKLKYDFGCVPVDTYISYIHQSVWLCEFLLPKLPKPYLEEIFLHSRNPYVSMRIFQKIRPIPKEILIDTHVKLLGGARARKEPNISIANMILSSLWLDHGISPSHPLILHARREYKEMWKRIHDLFRT